MIGYEFDFAKGDFAVADGKAQKIADKDLIKNRIEKLLRTEFDKYPIYTTYGMPFHSWFFNQRDRELIKIALTRELSERIPAHVDGVSQLSDFAFDFTRRGCRVSFRAQTTFDEEVQIEWTIS